MDGAIFLNDESQGLFVIKPAIGGGYELPREIIFDEIDTFNALTVFAGAKWLFLSMVSIALFFAVHIL